MSNKKTPEDQAKEFSKFDAATDIGTDLGSYRQGLFEGYLAGYKDGHHEGFESCLKIQEAVTEHLEKKMIDDMYVRIEPLLKEKI